MTYAVILVLAVVIGFYIFKKVTGCIIRLVLSMVTIAVLALLYFYYLA